MNAKRYITGFLFALAALLWTAPALAINGGVPDYGGHPNVGLLVFDVDGDGPTPPFAICSGSVISDHTFLTAAHCIITPLVPPGVQWAVTLAPGTPSAPLIPGGFFPDDYPACCAILDESTVIRATSVAVDPDYDASTGYHDLAVLVFPPGTFSVAPIELPRTGLLDDLAAAGWREGPQFTLVGYGTEVRDGGFYAAGYRKTARASFRDLADNWLFLSANVGELPRSGALCFGDSGSPQFLGGSNIAVALLHNNTGPVCDGVNSRTQRLDTPAEQMFLMPYR